MGQKRLLIIDDEKMITELLKQYLEPRGFEVITASNGEEGLALSKRKPPDLIVLDIQMPKKDGFVFYKEISTGHGQTKFPVLVMTGRGDLKDFFEGLDADGFIAKPFEMSDFLKEVDRILKNPYKGTIFIVDGLASPHAIRMAKALEEERYKVVHVEDLDSLAEFAGVRMPNFVLMEYVRKEMRGEEFIQKIREVLGKLEPNQDMQCEKTPIFVYSFSGMNYEAQALKAGAAKYLGSLKRHEDIVTILKEFELSKETSSKSPAG